MLKETIKETETLSILIYSAFKALPPKEYKIFCDDFNENYDYSTISDMSRLFFELSDLEYIPYLNTENVTNMSSLLQNCSSIEYIPLLKTSNVNNMSYAFSHCINLKKISLLNTENVLNMKSMFYKCENLKYFTNLNINKVTDISFMFSNCKKLRKCYFYQKINELNKNSNRCFENCDLLEKLENHKEFKLKRKEEKKIY